MWSTKGKGAERLAEASTQHGKIGGMVVGNKAEAGWTLPLLRDNWELPGAEEVLHVGVEARI